MGVDADVRQADERHMRLALAEAGRAARRGEVPVGAVLVAGGTVVARAGNAPIARRDPTAHAEILVLRRAGRALGNYRLAGATLYCTVEPCLMCLGAMVHARIARLVYGAPDPKVGATSLVDGARRDGKGLNHRFEVQGGVLGAEAAGLLSRFFDERRERAAEDGEVPKWS